MCRGQWVKDCKMLFSVITIKRNRDRLRRLVNRLDELRVDYRIVEGVDGLELTSHERRKRLDHLRFWCMVGRQAFNEEIGCKLSHEQAWSDGGDVICVLEDDALLADNFVEEVEQVISSMDSFKPQVVLLSRGRHELLFTDGYVMTRKAAEAIKADNTPMKCPCDYWWYWKNKGIIDVWHHPVPVVSQDIHQTTIGRSKSLCQMNLAEKIVWKIKRAIGRLLMLVLK